MKKNSKIIQIGKIKKTVLIIVAILLFLIVGYILYIFSQNNIYFKKINNYLIENKYYGFKLQTPIGWVVRGKTVYSEEKIAQLLADCKSNKIAKDLGEFRLQSDKYPESFGDAGYVFDKLPSGVILNIVVSCTTNDKIVQGDNLKIDGEEVNETTFDSPDFGKSILLSSLHNGLQYNITRYIYISKEDINRSDELKEKYNQIFNKIISSFKFTK